MNANQKDEIYNTSILLLGNFIHNMINNKQNNKVLVLCGLSYRPQHIVDLLKNTTSAYIIKNIEEVKDLNQLKYIISEGNHIILIVKNGFPFNIFKNVNLEMIIINVTYSGIIEDVLLNIQEYPKKIDLSPKLSNHLYLKKRELKYFLIMDYSTLSKNLSLIFERNNRNKFKITDSSITKFFMYKPMNVYQWLDQIQNHIIFLCEEKILTSRLAIVLYRIAYLDSTVSEKTIGEYISKLLSIKSSQKSSSRLGIKQCKAYNLNDCTLEGDHK